jgi:hypothetical protein
MEFMMHGDMGGRHNFRVHIFTDDPTEPERMVNVLSNWIE